MKRHLLTAFLCVLVWLAAAHAQSKPFGIGVIGGEPVGATMKVWFNPYVGMDVAAGADFGYPSRRVFAYDVPASFQTHIELLVHVPVIRTRGPRMPVYVGAGAKFNWRAGFQGVRARTPIGLCWLLPRKPFPWEVFFEFAPTWGRNPRPFDPDASMGVRYYF